VPILGVHGEGQLAPEYFYQEAVPPPEVLQPPALPFAPEPPALESPLTPLTPLTPVDLSRPPA
jgi:hypothetical protein